MSMLPRSGSRPALGTPALAITALALTTAAMSLAGCGISMTSPDLFVLTRTGPGRPLTLLVNDGGTIRCNGGTPKVLSNNLLLTARDLASKLDTDVKSALQLPARQGQVYSFTVRLQDGTLRFPDVAGAAHKELAQAELFAVQAAQRACGIG